MNVSEVSIRQPRFAGVKDELDKKTAEIQERVSKKVTEAVKEEINNTSQDLFDQTKAAIKKQTSKGGKALLKSAANGFKNASTSQKFLITGTALTVGAIVMPFVPLFGPVGLAAVGCFGASYLTSSSTKAKISNKVSELTDRIKPDSKDGE